MQDDFSASRERQATLVPSMLFTLLILGTLIARRWSSLSHPVLWCEDGNQWYLSELVYGPLRPLAMPYAGYLQFQARLIASLGAPFPASQIPRFYVWTALAASAACISAFQARQYRVVLQSDLVRRTVCLVCASAICADELLGTPTNLQWWMLFPGLLFMLIPRRSGWSWRSALGFAVGLTIGLSNPLLVITFPLLLLLLWKEGRTFFAAERVGVSLGVAVELAIGLSSTAAARGWDSRTAAKLGAALLGAVPNLVVLQTLIGHTLVDRLSASGNWLPAALALLVVPLLAGALLLFGNRAARRTTIVALYLMLTSIMVPFKARGLLAQRWDLLHFANRGERYYLLGASLLVLLVALAVESWLSELKKPMQAALVVLPFTGGILGNYLVAPLLGDDWKHSAPRIEQWARREREQLPQQSILVPILPVEWGLPLMLPGSLPNPGFEEGLTGWAPVIGSTVQLDSRNPRTGKAALELSGAPTGTLVQHVSTLPGHTYRFGAWFKVPCGPGPGQPSLRMHDAYDHDEIWAFPKTPTCDEWQPLSLDYAPTHGRYSRVELRCGHCEHGVEWDDLTFTETSR